jgi:hypothetical protein
VVKTDDIIAGRHNKEYLVSLEEVLTWYPADYTHKCGKCDLESLYHTCVSIELQWQFVFNNIIYPNEDHFSQVYQSVLQHGMVAQLRAKITENDHVVLLDGHNRVGVALDMSLEELPVYVGDKATPADDLIAADSGWWQKHNRPWVTIPR